MPDAIARIAGGILAIVFAWAAATKVLRYRDWRAALAAYRLGPLERVAALGAPVTEAVAAVLIVVGPTMVGAAVVIVMLSGFSLAILRARSRTGNRLPCGCFGKTKQRDYRLVLMRNGILGLLAAGILLSGDDVDVLGAIDLPERSEVVPAVLTGLAVIVAASIGLSVTRAFRRGRS